MPYINQQQPPEDFEDFEEFKSTALLLLPLPDDSFSSKVSTII
jgi:hypothetical protein